jgi:hypothetical protein
MLFPMAGALLAMVLAVAGLPNLLLQVESASAAVASPMVSGPVGGGTPSEFMFSTNFNLAQLGYQEQEFFITGNAKSYTSTTPLTTDGALEQHRPDRRDSRLHDPDHGAAPDRPGQVQRDRHCRMAQRQRWGGCRARLDPVT